MHLVLAGGGHAHQIVLRALAMRPEAGLWLTLVSPHALATYTGMVPGYLAGQYTRRETQIDLAALATRAGAEFSQDHVERIDAPARRVFLRQGGDLSYDLLSLDIGSRPVAADHIAADAPAAVVKPIEEAADRIDAAMAEPPPAEGRRIVVVGAGAGGCEIAFALAARLRREGAGTVTVCDPAQSPLAEKPPRASDLVVRAFAERNIDFVGDAAVVRVEAFGVRLADGRTIPASLVIWATGAGGPDLISRSSLPLDERGFLRVGDDLRCREYPEIFAAGDCATLDSYPELPKAGVYAVRQGPVLAANLRAAARARRTRDFRPQHKVLSLLNTGDGRAIFIRGDVAWRGRLAWWLKDWIDRRYVRQFSA